MGWKAVRDHYRIEHIVQVVPGKGICIGSAYIHDIIVINEKGDIVKKDRWGGRDSLGRYMKEFEEDPEKLRELVKTIDTFEKHIPVYTYEGGQIIERYCEEPEWPNVTHEGYVMYENTYSTNRNQVVEWALKNARSAVEMMRENVEQKLKDLLEARQKLKIRMEELESYEKIKGNISS